MPCGVGQRCVTRLLRERAARPEPTISWGRAGRGRLACGWRTGTPAALGTAGTGIRHIAVAAVLGLLCCCFRDRSLSKPAEVPDLGQSGALHGMPLPGWGGRCCCACVPDRGANAQQPGTATRRGLPAATDRGMTFDAVLASLQVPEQLQSPSEPVLRCPGIPVARRPAPSPRKMTSSLHTQSPIRCGQPAWRQPARPKADAWALMQQMHASARLQASPRSCPGPNSAHAALAAYRNILAFKQRRP